MRNSQPRHDSPQLCRRASLTSGTLAGLDISSGHSDPAGAGGGPYANRCAPGVRGRRAPNRISGAIRFQCLGIDAGFLPTVSYCRHIYLASERHVDMSISRRVVRFVIRELIRRLIKFVLDMDDLQSPSIRCFCLSRWPCDHFLHVSRTQPLTRRTKPWRHIGCRYVGLSTSRNVDMKIAPCRNLHRLHLNGHATRAGARNDRYVDISMSRQDDTSM